MSQPVTFPIANQVDMFLNNLTVIDCSYLDAKRGIVGESWIVDIVLSGDQDDQGMMMDFGLAKKQIKAMIDGTVDHTFVVPKRLPGLKLDADETGFSYTCSAGKIRYQGPAEAITLIDHHEVTPVHVGQYLHALIMEVVSDNVSEVALTLRPEVIDGPYYHYSHGLKKHAGNCQRIVHGHRSSIWVEQDGVRSGALEQEVASWLSDIYVVTQEDIVRTFVEGEIEYCEAAYTSAQGDFLIMLPRSMFHVISADSTVENIAVHLSHKLATSVPGTVIKVRAFEGVGKGALSSAQVEAT